MKYLQKTFSVPVAGPSVAQEDWDAIFGRRCRRCRGRLSDVTYPEPGRWVIRGLYRCTQCRAWEDRR